MRKEKLQQTDQQKVDIENTVSDATLRGALLRGTDEKGGYPCPRCKKRYNDENKLKAHLASHGKVRLIQYSFKFYTFLFVCVSRKSLDIILFFFFFNERIQEQNIHFVHQICYRFLNVHTNNHVYCYLFRQRKRTVTWNTRSIEIRYRSQTSPQERKMLLKMIFFWRRCYC